MTTPKRDHPSADSTGQGATRPASAEGEETSREALWLFCPGTKVIGRLKRPGRRSSVDLRCPRGGAVTGHDAEADAKTVDAAHEHKGKGELVTATLDCGESA